MMGGQNEMEQEIEFQPLNGTLVPFNGTPSSRVVNVTKFTRTFYTPTSGIIYALRSTKTFPRGLDRRQRRRKLIYLKVRMRFKRNTRAAKTV